jgi:hypothetical protein
MIVAAIAIGALFVAAYLVREVLAAPEGTILLQLCKKALLHI